MTFICLQPSDMIVPDSDRAMKFHSPCCFIADLTTYHQFIIYPSHPSLQSQYPLSYPNTSFHFPPAKPLVPPHLPPKFVASSPVHTPSFWCRFSGDRYCALYPYKLSKYNIYN